MTFRAKHFVLLVPFLLTGCIFHKKQAPPVQALAPALSTAPKPEPVHPDLPASDATIPSQPIKTTADESLPAKPTSRHHHQPTKPPQQVVNVPPSPPASETTTVSAIGQISTGGPTDLRNSVDESITSTEHGLNNIGRSFNDQEQKTAAQIREFLKQARDALTAGDVAGAKTLASKAKVLLSELSQ
jgi:hypothetical protein